MTAEDPGQEALLVLHEALLGGDIAARVRLAELLLPAMLRRFANRRDLERHEIESITGLCIATYLSVHRQIRPRESTAPCLSVSRH